MLDGMGVDGMEGHVTRVGKDVVPIDDKLVRRFGCAMLCILFAERVTGVVRKIVHLTIDATQGSHEKSTLNNEAPPLWLSDVYSCNPLMNIPQEYTTGEEKVDTVFGVRDHLDIVRN